ncbi:Glycosyltransferase family 28 C-terminal domain-containing protein [Candidatus Magnetomoraceae bacterium gMMP-15]
MAKKILILYEKMGMGHFRMAKIIHSILENTPDIELKMIVGSELLGTQDSKLVVWAWNFFLKKNWLFIADIFINFFLRLTLMPISEANHTKKFIKKIEKINPDVIVSTSDIYNKWLGTYAKNKEIPFYIIITDISIFIDLVNPYGAHIVYFKETAEAIRSYDFQKSYFSFTLDKNSSLYLKIKYIFSFYKNYLLSKKSIFRNIDIKLNKKNNAKVYAIGPLAEQKHFSSLANNISEKKIKLGISLQKPVILIASGSIGGMLLKEIVNTLSFYYKKSLNILIMCGYDKELYKFMQKLELTNNAIDLLPFSYQNNFENFLSCSDCVIARPSAGIFIESIIHRIPFLAYGKAPSNDKGSLSILKQYRIGEICNNNSLVSMLEYMLINNNFYKKNINKLLLKYPSTYEEKEKILKNIILFDTYK